MKHNKENIKKLLMDKYDKKMCLLELNEFYNNKTMESFECGMVWTSMLNHNEKELDILEREIIYLQKELKID